ncbi:MAG: hypothetical protein P4L83_15670 [Nevskia sp.]|nr:hypothetical protein [Nevskia sp.]
MTQLGKRHQRGGMISLLLGLLVLGVLVYFALRSHSATQTGAGGETQMVNCSKLANDLVARTHGIGPDYKAGYEALPPQCRSMLPPPVAAPTIPET